MCYRTPAPFERPTNRSQLEGSLEDPIEMDVASQLSFVLSPEGLFKSSMDPNADPCMISHPKKPASTIEDTARRFFDESVNPITTSLTQYEGAVRSRDTRLLAL